MLLFLLNIVDSLFIVAPFGCGSFGFVPCFVLQYFVSFSFTIISLRKENVAGRFAF